MGKCHRFYCWESNETTFNGCVSIIGNCSTPPGRKRVKVTLRALHAAYLSLWQLQVLRCSWEAVRSGLGGHCRRGCPSLASSYLLKCGGKSASNDRGWCVLPSEKKSSNGSLQIWILITGLTLTSSVSNVPLPLNNCFPSIVWSNKIVLMYLFRFWHLFLWYPAGLVAGSASQSLSSRQLS